MASMKLSLAVVFLLSGKLLASHEQSTTPPLLGGSRNAVVVMSAMGGAEEARCSVVCIQGGYITCDNYPYQKLDGCACECAPKDGQNCVLHLEHGPPSNCPPQA
ncbi:hypothetical protein DAI22_03g328200 [Oryza sativa Japonica Group]|nr:hypothetical protein DAI22_03g328200 [Oryza sativa Japonica Group]